MLISLNQGLLVSGRFEAEDWGESDQSVLGLQPSLFTLAQFLLSQEGNTHKSVKRKSECAPPGWPVDQN